MNNYLLLYNGYNNNINQNVVKRLNVNKMTFKKITKNQCYVFCKGTGKTGKYIKKIT